LAHDFTHTAHIPHWIARGAQRVGHSVRNDLAGCYEDSHRTLLFQTAVLQVGRDADDFEIALLTHERDAPPDRIVAAKVSTRQSLADHYNGRGGRLVAVVNLTPEQDWNLHGSEETRSGDQHACAFNGNGANLHGPPGMSGPDDRGLRMRRAAHARDRFEAPAQVRVKRGDLRAAIPGLARVQREEKDVLASVSQLDRVQLIECPHK